jgi:hypothetical protein
MCSCALLLVCVSVQTQRELDGDEEDKEKNVFMSIAGGIHQNDEERPKKARKLKKWEKKLLDVRDMLSTTP